MPTKKIAISLTGKNVVVLGDTAGLITEHNIAMLGSRLCETVGDNTDIVVVGDGADAAQVKRVKKGVQILDIFEWLDAYHLALEDYEKASAATKATEKRGPESKHKAKRIAKTTAGMLAIYIPCVEEDWEYGRLLFSEEARANMPVALRKKIGEAVDGWQINYGKTSIGLVFDLSDSASVSRLEQALDAGWESWIIRYDWSHSSVVPTDIVVPGGVKGQYVELRARVGRKMVENLESYGEVEFEPGGNEGPEPDRPDDSTLYDCSGRGEAPWKVTLATDNKVKVLYNGKKRRISDAKLKQLILDAIG